MTVEEVEAWVRKIGDLSWESEEAHSEEDALHCAVMQAIAEGAENAPMLAAAALKTGDIKFERWYA